MTRDELFKAALGAAIGANPRKFDSWFSTHDEIRKAIDAIDNAVSVAYRHVQQFEQEKAAALYQDRVKAGTRKPKTD